MYLNFPLSLCFLTSFFSSFLAQGEAKAEEDLLHTSCRWNPVEQVAAKGRKWNTCLPPRHISASNQTCSHAGRSGTDKTSRNQSSHAHGFQLELGMLSDREEMATAKTVLYIAITAVRNTSFNTNSTEPLECEELIQGS